MTRLSQIRWIGALVLTVTFQIILIYKIITVQFIRPDYNEHITLDSFDSITIPCEPSYYNYGSNFWFQLMGGRVCNSQWFLLQLNIWPIIIMSFSSVIVIHLIKRIYGRHKLYYLLLIGFTTIFSLIMALIFQLNRTTFSSNNLVIFDRSAQPNSFISDFPLYIIIQVIIPCLIYGFLLNLEWQEGMGMSMMLPHILNTVIIETGKWNSNRLLVSQMKSFPGWMLGSLLFCVGLLIVGVGLGKWCKKRDWSEVQIVLVTGVIGGMNLGLAMVTWTLRGEIKLQTNDYYLLLFRSYTFIRNDIAYAIEPPIQYMITLRLGWLLIIYGSAWLSGHLLRSYYFPSTVITEEDNEKLYPTDNNDGQKRRGKYRLRIGYVGVISCHLILNITIWFINKSSEVDLLEPAELGYMIYQIAILTILFAVMLILPYKSLLLQLLLIPIYQIRMLMSYTVHRLWAESFFQEWTVEYYVYDIPLFYSMYNFSLFIIVGVFFWALLMVVEGVGPLKSRFSSKIWANS